MDIGIVGCGYVADFYAKNAKFYGNLTLKGAFDIHQNNLNKFCSHYSITAYPTLDALLEDSSIQLVLNLTNPKSHYAISKACLDAGKHVYTEKPLAMNMAEATDLLQYAVAKNLRIGSAPCSVLSNTAQTVWKAIQNGELGKVRLIYANYDDGMIAPNMRPWEWNNSLSVPWPAKDEFEVGCTYEHAAYFLSWLTAIFGPAQSVTSFSSCQISNKGIEVEQMAPDFSVGCIEYNDGIVARVTCGLVAPRDKSLMIVGDKGYLFVRYLRNDSEPVFVRRDAIPKNQKRIENLINRIQLRLKRFEKYIPWPLEEFQFYDKLPYALDKSDNYVSATKRVDFMLGPNEMVNAIKENRQHRLSGEFSLHLLEQIEALQYPEKFGYRRKIQSNFMPIKPLEWH